MGWRKALERPGGLFGDVAATGAAEKTAEVDAIGGAGASFLLFFDPCLFRSWSWWWLLVWEDKVRGEGGDGA